MAAILAVITMQGQNEDVTEQLNEEEQLLIITRLHQVRLFRFRNNECGCPNACTRNMNGPTCVQKDPGKSGKI